MYRWIQFENFAITAAFHALILCVVCLGTDWLMPWVGAWVVVVVQRKEVKVCLVVSVFQHHRIHFMTFTRPFFVTRVKRQETN